MEKRTRYIIRVVAIVVGILIGMWFYTYLNPDYHISQNKTITYSINDPFNYSELRIDESFISSYQNKTSDPNLTNENEI